VIHVPDHERGVLRVFAVDSPDTEAATFVAAPASGLASPFNMALVKGLTLNHDFVEAFPVARLHEVGHPDLLSYVSGAPVKPADLAHNTKTLKAQTGWVVLIWSKAFGGAAAELHPTPLIRLVSSLRLTEPDEPSTARRMPKPDAAPLSAAMQRRNRITGIALITLVLVALGLVYVGLPF
jgi:hypothetical protein